MTRFETLNHDPTIILIRPHVSRFALYKWYAPLGSREPSMGLLYLASFLASEGYKVSILDGEISGEAGIMEAIKKINPDIIGITSSTFSFNRAALLASRLRMLSPDCLLLLGGPHASALPGDSLLRIPELDGVIFGEGEETMLEIVRKKKPAEIQGLAWREGGSIIINKSRENVKELDRFYLKWELLEHFPQQYSPPLQSRKKNSASLVISRGCCYDCSFCASSSVWGKQIRYHSPRYVVRLMTDLENLYGITDFYFHDDYLPAKPAWMREFCEMVINEKKSFTWSCASRVEILCPDLLRLMKSAGCCQIGIGIESTSQQCLNRINKKCNPMEFSKGIEKIANADIKVKGYFMLGIPGEKMSDLVGMIKYILNNRISSLQVNYYTPLPGSKDFIVKNPPIQIWKKMSLQNPLGYSDINPLIYFLFELIFYSIGYTKILAGRLINLDR